MSQFFQTTAYIRAHARARKETQKGNPYATEHHTWNHYGSKEQCLCDCNKCFSMVKGCICPTCSGLGHWACQHAEFKDIYPGIPERVY